MGGFRNLSALDQCICLTSFGGRVAYGVNIALVYDLPRDLDEKKRGLLVSEVLSAGFSRVAGASSLWLTTSRYENLREAKQAFNRAVLASGVPFSRAYLLEFSRFEEVP